MFSMFVDLSEYLSSTKLIVGSVLIFVFLFALNVGVIAGISDINKVSPFYKKRYLVVCSSITFVLNIIFFILSLYDKASIVLVLILLATFIYLQCRIFAKFSEYNSALTKVVIIQTAVNSVLYFMGSYFLSGLYILFFCMNGI